MVCPVGFEPTASTLEECCSSAELRAQISQMLMMGVLIINIFVLAFSIYALSGTPAQFIGIEQGLEPHLSSYSGEEATGVFPREKSPS